ncbi:SPFH domain-containing protein [Gulosibacter sp. 10]|uniref:SPFH domain-containing protein n=1 Tax=Gulosibacter sp. 10 TaxID=1255570 RepID=UPI00097EC770|nr:SPFH domain-containing protein [Gulosibacter sp. 10]SJM65286.1 Membrane protease family protein BA0301 [Gulosibacter sp. 10]
MNPNSQPPNPQQPHPQFQGRPGQGPQPFANAGSPRPAAGGVPGQPPRGPQGFPAEPVGGGRPPAVGGPAPQAPNRRPEDGIRERRAISINGLLGLLIGLGLMVVGVVVGFNGARAAGDSAPGGGSGGGVLAIVLGILLFVLGWLLLQSLTINGPGDSKVVQFFGSYIGTIRAEGLRMTVPLTRKRPVSVKVRNFETHELKVNDADGNPINIAAIIVWRVADTARAVFSVEHFQQFVAVQSESALRHVASTHPYDDPGPGETSLRGSAELISREIAEEVAARIGIAGLEVVEARISSLAYAPEIAQSMLQRQQASAVIAARERIVEGAVTMVQQAVQRLEDDGTVALDADRRAEIVSNMLVVLTSDQTVTPVINTAANRPG